VIDFLRVQNEINSSYCNAIFIVLPYYIVSGTSKLNTTENIAKVLCVSGIEVSGVARDPEAYNLGKVLPSHGR